MRIYVPLLHDLHRRNWRLSGCLDDLRKRGHVVTEEDRPIPRFRRLRAAFRVASMVAREPGSRTYQNKLSRLRGGARLQASVWRRWRRMGRDPEATAAAIEGHLPVSVKWKTRMMGPRQNLLLWPTMIHMDAVDNDVVKAARALGIPVLAAVSSWDTLTTKGGLLVRPDRLMVWGEVSARHAVERHGFAPADVFPTGPPHFVPYEGGLSASRGSVLLVAGTSIHFWAEELQMVATLGQHFPGRVLWRPHPRRLGERLQAPRGVLMDARLGWGSDVAAVRASLDASCGVVAAFSTVVIEAALSGRPSALIGFGGSEHSGALLDHAAWEHMAEVAAWPSVETMMDLEQLTRWCALALDGRLAHDPETLRACALAVANGRPGIWDRIAAAVGSFTVL